MVKAMQRQVWELVARLQREKNTAKTIKTNQSSTIDQMLLIDRSVDLATPLATQLTYEGLIDEIFLLIIVQRIFQLIIS